MADGQPAQALAGLERALALNPSHARARFHRAVILVLSGRAAEAGLALLDIASEDGNPYADRARRCLTERMRARAGEA